MTLALEAPITETTVSHTGATERRTDLDELVRTHLPLVGHLVREMLARVPAQVRRDDLTSAALAALAGCARSFDPSNGAPFAAYASLRIRGALTDELRSMDWASRGVRAKAREIETVRATLTHTLGRTPSSTEVAQSMSVSLKELSAVASDVHRASVTSLSALPVEDSESMLPSNEDGPEALLLRREQLGYLRDAVAELPERLRTVVEQSFFGQRRMIDIAIELGVTESRVSQMRSEALALLRHAMAAADGNDSEGRDSAGDHATAGTARGTRRQEAAMRFATSVAARSSMAERLSATTLLADFRG